LTKKYFLICLFLYPLYASAAQEPVSFANTGQFKMLFDRRQRPPSVYLDNKVHIVFNAGGEPGAEPKAPTKPMAITYDPATREFSEIVTLGPGDGHHHYGPVVWADEDGYLHVLYGCHRTPGTHFISKQPGSIGNSLDSWDVAPQIAPGISYPTVYSIYDNQELIYYRTGGHTSSWTYRISDDNGRSWTAPANDVTDMNINGALDWSSYQSKLVSKDGKFLHVAFITFDDNKANDPNRFYNPRYNQAVYLKYNLYYIKINLQTDEVVNADGETLQTPIDLALANSKCMIWDTQWRGSGVPPTILLDENDEPSFVHVISEETLEDHQYYYVRRENGQWKQTPIVRTSNKWNASHLTRDKAGTLHALLIAGDYLDSDGYMDKHGGGTIEEWISSDNGNSWALHRDLTPDPSKYPGWRYNNIQPVTKSDGSNVDNMLLFYGWLDLNAPEAEAFLLHNDTAWYDMGIGDVGLGGDFAIDSGVYTLEGSGEDIGASGGEGWIATIPELATILLLGLGALMLRKR